MKHALTFRGQDYAIPAGWGLCTTCGALLTVEQWIDTACPGRVAPKEEANENARVD